MTDGEIWELAREAGITTATRVGGVPLVIITEAATRIPVFARLLLKRAKEIEDGRRDTNQVPTASE